jgi:ubiquinone/menaquinone biosynthesis C-methylase UbiE
MPTNPINQAQQNDLVREQFTRTAQVFGDFAVATRGHEAELLASLVRAGLEDFALDVACGPGTLALRFARHVRRICGLDLTPAILGRARNSAAAKGLANLDFVLGDAQALPFADGALDIAVTSYSLHHMAEPARVIGEMARVVRPGGRVGVADIRVSEDPRSADINNRIERLRDASHTRTLARSEFETIFARNGLRILAAEIEEKYRPFDHWLLVAGWKPGDHPYEEARLLLESTLSDDLAGFHPKIVTAPPGSGRPELHITNTVLFLAGEKI